MITRVVLGVSVSKRIGHTAWVVSLENDASSSSAFLGGHGSGNYPYFLAKVSTIEARRRRKGLKQAFAQPRFLLFHITQPGSGPCGAFQIRQGGT